MRLSVSGFGSKEQILLEGAARLEGFATMKPCKRS